MKLSYIFALIRTLFCDHDYGDGKLCPFTDEYDNYMAVYTCSKCGKNKLVVFNKR